MSHTITLRTELHPSGSLMIHAGNVAGLRVEAHQNEQAHNARNGGSWFLTIGVEGHPLRCYSQHRTLGDAREFANAVIATAAAPAANVRIPCKLDFMSPRSLLPVGRRVPRADVFSRLKRGLRSEARSPPGPQRACIRALPGIAKALAPRNLPHRRSAGRTM